ncbi:MAG: hypothetical protein ING25_04255 [Burkholderiales bacterium]|jgi:hypothetical protein|nr:hypothetical protein [Burkholderiales bacterium]
MKDSHFKTPRTLGDCKWEIGYYSVEDYAQATAEVTRYAAGLFVCAVALIAICWFMV